jgi:hypothetical protein
LARSWLRGGNTDNCEPLRVLCRGVLHLMIAAIKSTDQNIADEEKSVTR